MTASEKKQFLAQYNEIHDSLMRFCIVKSRGIMDPRDLANDVLLVGLENYHKLNDKKALLSYLFTTANRICLNKIRRKKFDGYYDEDQAALIQDPSNNVESNADITLLYQALDQLPPLQKEAVTLFEISDLPIKEIMAIQDAGESAVKQRIKRGREKLAELLREKERKKVAIALTTLLISTNSFSMSNLDHYFQAVKDLPLPLSETEAISTISNFNAAGAAANSTAAKIGAGIVKKIMLSSVLVGGIVGTTFLLSTTSEAQPESNNNVVISSTPGQNPPITRLENGSDFTNPDNHKDAASHENVVNAEQAEDHHLHTDTITNNSTNEFITVVEDEESIFSEDEIVKEENITKIVQEGETFSLKGLKEVYINHLGDNVTFKTWEKDLVEVIPEYTIKTKKPEDAERISAELSYKAERKGNRLIITDGTCGTSVQGSVLKNGYSTMRFADGTKVKYKELSSDYIIMIPKQINLKINGSYQNVTVPNLDGDLTANMMDGHVEVGDITGKAEIKMHYSTGEFGDIPIGTIFLMESTVNTQSVKKVHLTLRYSTLNATSLSLSKGSVFDSKLIADTYTGDLDLSAKHSYVKFKNAQVKKAKLSAFETKLFIPSIEELTGNMRYSLLESGQVGKIALTAAFESNFKIEQVETLNAVTSKYSNYDIQSLSKRIKLNSFEDYLFVGELSASLSEIDCAMKYSKYEINLAKSAHYRIDFSANYGTLDYDGLDIVFSHLEKSEFKSVLIGIMEGGSEDSPLLKFSGFESHVKLN